MIFILGDDGMKRIMLLALAFIFLMLSPLEAAPKWQESAQHIEQVVTEAAAIYQSGDAETAKKCDAAWELIKGDYFNYHR